MTTFEYIDGGGGTLTLGTGCRRLMGYGGVGMVAPEHYWLERPYQDGDEHLGYRVPRRVMNFVVKSASSTRGSAWEEKRDMADAFNLDKGEGRLRVTLPNSTQRQTTARFAGGMDFSTQDSPHHLQQDFPIQLVCDGPYWEDPAMGTVQASFSGASSVAVTCTNSGDVPVRPYIYVYSTVDHPVVELDGVGEVNVNVNVTSGSLVVDCAEATVTKGTGSRMGSATSSSIFTSFALERGSNTVNLTADSGSGLCRIKWTEQYTALKK